MVKPADNPPSLTPLVRSVAELTGGWSVLQTKSRAEKALAWELIASRVGYFLPLIRKLSFSGGRKRVGMQPLFPGYIFVNSMLHLSRNPLASRHVARIIPVGDQRQLSDELGTLERAMLLGVRTFAFPHIEVGQRKRIKGGPLTGISGTVVNFEGVTHVVLEVTVLGQRAAVPVDQSLLEPAED